MLAQIDLKELSRMGSHDRAYMSIFMKAPGGLERMEKIISNMEKVIADNKDESKHFKENMKMVRQYLSRNPHTSGGLCIFCCWLEDYLEAYPLEIPPAEGIWLDSSPYVRPIAEMKDEYENYAVVAADNSRARIYLVTSGTAEEEEKIRGNIKNHVRVGGWSQQRYERRRDKQLLHYAKDIAEALLDLDRENSFDRVVMVGSRETLQEINKALPQQIRNKSLSEKVLDLGQGDDVIEKEIFELFTSQERQAEMDLWERVRENYLRGQLAAVGPEQVLEMARIGRVDSAILNRNAKLPGIRCRECEGLFHGEQTRCPKCDSDSVFPVDFANELVEIIQSTGARVDFSDHIEGLEKLGHVAAILRY